MAGGVGIHGRKEEGERSGGRALGQALWGSRTGKGSICTHYAGIYFSSLRRAVSVGWKVIVLRCWMESEVLQVLP